MVQRMGMMAGPLVCLEGGTIGVSDRLGVRHIERQARSLPALLKDRAV